VKVAALLSDSNLYKIEEERLSRTISREEEHQPETIVVDEGGEGGSTDGDWDSTSSSPTIPTATPVTDDESHYSSSGEDVTWATKVHTMEGTVRLN